jgi:hypothetical protein
VPDENRGAEALRRVRRLEQRQDEGFQELSELVKGAVDGIGKRLDGLQKGMTTRQQRSRATGYEEPPGSQHQADREPPPANEEPPMSEDKMREFLKKQGVVTQHDIEEAQATQQAVQEYPELADPNSEFFQDAQAEAVQMRRDGYAGPDVWQMAADKVARKSGVKPASRREVSEGRPYVPQERPGRAGPPGEQEATLNPKYANIFNMSPAEKKAAQRYAQEFASGKDRISIEDTRERK